MQYHLTANDTRLAAVICKQAAPWSGTIYDQASPHKRLKIECKRGKVKNITLQSYDVGETTKMRVYIAGPMRGPNGHEDPNKLEQFDRTAAIIAELGHHPISPLDLSRKKVLSAGLDPDDITNYRKFPNEDYMEADIRAMRDVDCVVLLPGWTNSKGVAVEIAYAHYRGIQVYASIEEFEYLTKDAEKWNEAFRKQAAA